MKSLLRTFQSLSAHTLRVLTPCECHVCQRPLAHGFICRCCEPKIPAVIPNDTRCPVCYTVMLHKTELCNVCLSYPLPFRRMIYLWEYGDSVRDLICAMKYRPSRSLCHGVGAVMGEFISELSINPDWNLIIPIPASRKTLTKRGFNQCALLANSVSSSFPVPIEVSNELLIQSLTSDPRAGMDQKRRLRSRVSLKVTKPELVLGANVLLIEDVITTGITAVSAGNAILNAGACSVDILALARAPSWQRLRARVYKRCLLGQRTATNKVSSREGQIPFGR